MMKKPWFAIPAVLLLLAGTVYADDYQWDLIDALVKNDIQRIETIINNHINTLPPPEKQLVMNFALTYSRGETTARVIDLLLGRHVVPNGLDLYTAINQNHPDAIVQLLLRSGAVPNGEILLLAMAKQRFDLAKQCIEAGVDVNYQYPPAGNGADGMTPLLHAARWNNAELARLLVEKGANIHARAANGNTALTLAQEHGNHELSNYLMERGAAVPEPAVAAPSPNSAAGNQTAALQSGTYRLAGNSSTSRILTGDTSSGWISHVNFTNNSVKNGIYVINSNTITIAIDGSTTQYRIDSPESFSGHGQTWLWAGN